MKSPVLYSGVLFSAGPFDVYAGAKSDEEYPVYVVLNRDTGIVEFSSEVLWQSREWTKHFADKLQPQTTQEQPPKDNVVPFPSPKKAEAEPA